MLVQVLEESDDDSGDEWTPAAAARVRGSSEEAGSGSGLGRGPAGGSNTTSSVPPRSSPSSEDAVNVQPQQKKQRIEMTPPVVTGRAAPLYLCSLIDYVCTMWYRNLQTLVPSSKIAVKRDSILDMA